MSESQSVVCAVGCLTCPEFCHSLLESLRTAEASDSLKHRTPSAHRLQSEGVSGLDQFIDAPVRRVSAPNEVARSK